MTTPDLAAAHDEALGDIVCGDEEDDDTGQAWCTHCRAVARSCAGESGPTMVQKFTDAAIFFERQRCRKAGAWAMLVLCSLGSTLDDRVHSLEPCVASVSSNEQRRSAVTLAQCKSNTLAQRSASRYRATSDTLGMCKIVFVLSRVPREETEDGEAMRSASLRGKVRRLRIDEDARRELVQAAAGGAQSATAAHDKFLGHGKTDARRVFAPDRAARMAQSWRLVQGAGAVTIAADASTISKPGEDTMCYAAAWRLRTARGYLHFGTWLPPQAPLLSRSTALNLYP